MGVDPFLHLEDALSNGLHSAAAPWPLFGFTAGFHLLHSWQYFAFFVDVEVAPSALKGLIMNGWCVYLCGSIILLELI